MAFTIERTHILGRIEIAAGNALRCSCINAIDVDVQNKLPNP
ncbi:hypothetical protein APA_4962 [Pseudanabaena sp. lw0831]|nr:hypothetical protein APA_4962 [Pseudanabaena sp. lw0831]